MAGQTKMIIITSDEDIIRQFSFNKGKNTHVIDLDNTKQIPSNETDDNNTVNLALLAELSKLNSSNDQVYKRALDSPQHNPSRSVKTSRRSIDMTCAICGDQAIGFNYDVPSCASCKAFFRRNANHNMDTMRCLTGRGQCSVAHETRRKCQKCRLERCFSAGMRKDFILSDEDKQKRRKRLEDNRNVTTQRLSTTEPITPSSSSITQSVSNSESLSPTSGELDRLLMNMNEDEGYIDFDENGYLNKICDESSETLSIEDWITIESLRSSFVSTFQKDDTQHPSVDYSDRTTALISWSHIANENAIRFIDFCRQLPEFESLHADDRFILIKYNLFPVYPILKCFYHNTINHPCMNADTEEAAKHRRFYTLCFGSDGIRDMFMTLTLSLIEVTEQDPVILSLLLAILMLYQGLSMNENEPPLKDSFAVFKGQSNYTNVLINYMISKWGEVQTWKRFSLLITAIFRMQLAAKTFREFFHAQFATSNIVDKIAPLMQTVLHIS